MRKSSKKTKYSEVLFQLKNLPPEDRMVLGLYLYEGLTSEEVSQILNSKPPSPGVIKQTRKTAQRSRHTV